MSASHPVIVALREILGPRGILTDADELTVYESDGFPVARGLPTAVVFPESTEHVAACMRAVAEHDEVQIIPRGSGTGLAGGCVAFGGGVIINTSRMNRIESIDHDNRVAVVQAGVRNTQLSDAVADSGLHFSPDPSSEKASTIGGNAATNAGGINTLKHGVTTNHILGLEMVLADGTVLQSRAAMRHDGVGPDLPGLICGSEGTLGVITRLWCRLTPRPRSMRTVYAMFSSTRDGAQTVADVIATGIIPTSMEMVDGAMVKVIEDAFHFGFPANAEAMLLIEIDGVEAILDDQLATIKDVCRTNHASDIESCSDPKRRAELWSARKRAFGAIGRISHSYCTQDACVPRSKLPEVLERVGEIGEEYGLTITNVFHAGDGNIHPILLFDEDDPVQVQNTLRASEEILKYCIDVGGALTGEHGVGVEKLHLMDYMFEPATIQLFQAVKKAFDPGQRINDGKLIPSDRRRIELLKPVAANVPGGAL